MEEEEEEDGGVSGGGAALAEAPRLANVIWWGTGVTDRSVNAAIWFGLEQISAAFWGQNNPALPICRGGEGGGGGGGGGGEANSQEQGQMLGEFQKKKKNLMNKSGERREREATGRGKKITRWWAAGMRS